MKKYSYGWLSVCAFVITASPITFEIQNIDRTAALEIGLHEANAKPPRRTPPPPNTAPPNILPSGLGPDGKPLPRRPGVFPSQYPNFKCWELDPDRFGPGNLFPDETPFDGVRGFCERNRNDCVKFIYPCEEAPERDCYYVYRCSDLDNPGTRWSSIADPDDIAAELGIGLGTNISGF